MLKFNRVGVSQKATVSSDRRRGVFLVPSTLDKDETASATHGDTPAKELQVVPASSTKSNNNNNDNDNDYHLWSTRHSASGVSQCSVFERLRHMFTVVSSESKPPSVTHGIRVARVSCLEAWMKLLDPQLYVHFSSAMRDKQHFKHKMMLH